MNTQRRGLTWFLCGVAVAGLAICSAMEPFAPKAGKVQTVTEKDSGKNVGLAVGDRLIVRLKSNPTTGYSWMAVKLSSAALKQVGKPKYESDPDPKPGSGGTDVFTYDAAKAGKATLVFTYQRPWEKKPPTQKLTFNVTVTKPTMPPNKPTKGPTG
jgi:predicted secreted protein